MFPLKDNPPQLVDVAKKIVKSCKGLALSIVVIGGLLLKSPSSVWYWENVLKGLEINDSKEKQQGLDALFLSYNHLPPHLKPCFIYMGTFEEDSRIRASNITRLWVAEGFIKPKGTRVLEDIAEDQLKDLIDRNLVLGVERGFTGKIKSFSIHDLLRDLCIKVGEQQEFFHVWKPNKSLSRTVRRVVCEPFTEESGAALARSFLGNNYSLDYVKHKLLRVFDASGYRYSNDVYGSNVNLRYLVHKQLSANLCLVWNLQTLIIENGYTFEAAPLGIWDMRQLRHVKCSRVHIPSPPPRRYGQDRMEQLQTLSGAVNLRLSEETCEMIPNIKKLGLMYEDYDAGVQGMIDCLHNLDRFHKLESLSIEMVPDQRTVRYLELRPKLAFPLSLNKLSLNYCQLSWDDLTSVTGSLPQLQVLHLELLRDVMRGGMWSPVVGQFLRLKILRIELCYICCWNADSSHFPVLEKLLLRGLAHELEIPLEIGEIPTLGLIRVEFCDESVTISAVKIKKDQVENYDNDALQIEVLVSDSSKLESLKKRVETEELELSLFKLETY